MITVQVVRDERGMQQALEIRRQVFIQEQGIPRELEEDGQDGEAIHLLVCLDGLQVATGRLLPREGGAGNLSRVAVLSPFRSLGLGKLLVRELEEIARERGLTSLFLHPHHYLETFYANLGYRKVAGDYMAGGHRLIRMEKTF